MKFVYVLTSCEKDFFYEQFLLSLASFRLFNPLAEVVVLIDEKTKRGLTGKRAGYEKLVSDIKVINVPDEFSQKEASRWIKTSIHHYVSSGFLYIDCDTVIAEKLENDFSPEIKIGAVLDTHVTLDKHHLKKSFQNEDKKVNFISSFKTNVRYNGGIIYCSGSEQSLDFFETWHSYWLKSREKGCSQDMPSLNQADFDKGGIITEIDGAWNCQIAFNGLPYLSTSKIIHYFAQSLLTQSSPFIPASDTVLENIKATGDISKETLELLSNPRAAFTPQSRILSGNEILDLVNSNIFAKLLWLRAKTPKLFNTLNGISLLFKNAKHKKSTP